VYSWLIEVHLAPLQWSKLQGIIVQVEKWPRVLSGSEIYCSCRIPEPFCMISPWWMLHWNDQFDCSCALFTRRFNWVLRMTDTNTPLCPNASTLGHFSTCTIIPCNLLLLDNFYYIFMLKYHIFIVLLEFCRN
jgi:hypothetical protein